MNVEIRKSEAIIPITLVVIEYPDVGNESLRSYENETRHCERKAEKPKQLLPIPLMLVYSPTSEINC